jgi:SAM-dependent methyltransferase
MEEDKYLILIVMVILFVVVMQWLPEREGFKNNTTERLENLEVWDEFYAEVYDQLFDSKQRIDYELSSIMKAAFSKWPPAKLNVLDLGSGTGNYTTFFSTNKIPYTGLEQSPFMIKKAREKNPAAKYIMGDAMQPTVFAPNTFSHIMCMYFTLYSFPNQRGLLQNCFAWLKPGGFFIVHVADPEMFDPVLDAASPFPAFSLQKYSTERVTESEIVFDQFTYRSKFAKEPDSDDALFSESFEFPDGKVREHRHDLYMPPLEDVESLFKSVGFTLKEDIDLMPVEFEYQNILIFQK